MIEIISLEDWIDIMEQFDNDTTLSAMEAHLDRGAKNPEIKNNHSYGFLSGHSALLNELSKSNPEATVNSIMQALADSKHAEHSNKPKPVQLEAPNFDDVLSDAIQNGSIDSSQDDSDDDDNSLRM